MKENKAKQVKDESEEGPSEREKLLARLLLLSPGGATDVLVNIREHADWKDTFDDLKSQLDRVKNGDLTMVEQILVSQAQVLQAVFNSQMRRTLNAQYMDQGEYHSKIAFRAQNQCLRTLRTLVDFKNPKRATFIKQQNNLQLNQEAEKSEKKVNPANKVLEHDHESRLDFGEKEETSGSHQEMEAVGKIDRAED